MGLIDGLHIIAIAGAYGGVAAAMSGTHGLLIYAISVALGSVAYLAGGWRTVILVGLIAVVLALLA